MTKLCCSFKKKLVTFAIMYLAVAVFTIGVLPKTSFAYVALPENTSELRLQDMDKVQRVLESKLVSGKLESMGLGASEVMDKVEALSDSELHSFASQMVSLEPGGDIIGVVIGLLVIGVLVLVIMNLTGHKVVIN